MFKHTMNKIILLLTFSIPLLFSAEKPNIVLIIVDDMGWSDLGCYGGEIKTPNINKLADDGIRFRKFYNTAKCSTSRAALLCGLYPAQTGTYAKVPKTYKNAVTLGEVLKEAGYKTYASGKHHSEESLYDRGFDRYYGLNTGACNHFNPGLKREGEAEPGRKGHPRFWTDDSLRFNTRDKKYQNYFPAGFYSTDVFTTKAIEYLNDWKKNDSKNPFFLYLAYTAPHDPLQAWQKDIDKYEGVYDVGFEKIREARYKKQKKLGLIDPKKAPLSIPTHKKWRALSKSVRKEQTKRMQIHAAMVDCIDQNIGKLIKSLKDNQAYEDTLILFCSDNGAQNYEFKYNFPYETGTVGSYQGLGVHWSNVSNSPFRYDKESSYNGGVRTPMIMHWPKKIVKPGRITNKTGHLVDFMATFVDITKAKYPKRYNGQTIHPMEGVSLTDVIKNKEKIERPPIYNKWKNGCFVIDGDYKLVSKDKGKTWALYDLRKDDTETKDLSKKDSKKYKELLVLFKTWEKRMK